MVGDGQSKAGLTRSSALPRLGLHDLLTASAEHVCRPGKLRTLARVMMHALHAPTHVMDEGLALLMHSFTQYPHLPAHSAWQLLRLLRASTCSNASIQNTNGTYL